MKQIGTYIVICLALLAWAMPAQGEGLNYPLDTINGQVYYRYTVERSIGLYRISVNFGVTQEEILKANPQLQHRGLRMDEVILVPAKLKATEDKQVTKPEEVKEKKRQRLVLFEENKETKRKKPIIDNTPMDTLALDTLSVDTLAALDSTAIRLALLLPLHANAIKREKNMERFYDFYAGALIAIYEAQHRGQHMEIFTYDIGKTATRTKEVLSQHPEIHTMHAIIGPAYAQQTTTVLDSVQEDSIWCLIPFLSHLDKKNPYTRTLKFNPSEQIAADTLAHYLAQRKDSVNCILIEQKEGEVIPSGIMALHKALQQHEVPTTTIALKAILNDSIDSAFRNDIENIVIFNTERYANLQTVMPHLLKACGNYRITLFSHYSWQNEKIILPQLYTSVFSPAPMVPDSYEQLFEQYFNHELSSTQPRYDLLGYDLTAHLLAMLQQTNDTTPLTNESWNGIQANIHYIQTTPQSGYENHNIHIIHQ